MSENGPPRRRSLLPRFTLATLLLVMVVCGALGACVYYGIQAVGAGFSADGALVIIALCAPVVLLLAVKVAHLLLQWIDPPRP